jgi:hypothetical protein
MKFWFSDLTGRRVGLESDFPVGTKGMTLRDVIDSTATAVADDLPVAAITEDMGQLLDQNDKRLVLEHAYLEKYGKKPHPAMKYEKLKSAVEG